MTEAVAWTATDDAVIVLHLDSAPAKPLALKGPAILLWEELVARAPLSTADLVSVAAEAFEVSAAAVHDEIATLLHQLQAEGLIVQAASSAEEAGG